MKSARLFAFIAIALSAVFFSSCGSSSSGGSGSGPGPAQIKVSISPGAQNLQTSATLQFSAAVSGTSNTAVSWEVGGVAGGNAAVGKISASGLYTAPAAVPNPNTVTVSATSQADSTASASVILTIVLPPISISVAPATANVETKYTQKFTATVTNSSNSSVIWQVNGVTGGNATVGTIDASGTYTAPRSVPSSASVTVTAVSAADSTKSASATVTITAPQAPKGTWSFIGPSGASSSNVLIGADPHDPSLLYASAGFRGVYKSTDQGKTWQLIFSNADNGLAGTNFTPVYVGPTSGTLYLLGADDKIRISKDGGATFTSVTAPSGLKSSLNALPFAIHSNADSTVYLSAGSSIFRSIDGGSTWHQMALPPGAGTTANPNSPLVSFGSSPETILVGTASGIQASTDNGSTWKVQNTGLDANFLNVRQIIQDFANPKRLLISAGYTGTGVPDPSLKFYESTDGGMIWTDLGKYGLSLAEAQTGPDLLAVQGGLWRSADSGISWQNIADPMDVNAQHAFMIPNAAGTIFYEGESNLHVSTDSGKTWSVDDSTIQARRIGHLEIAGSTIYANDVDGGLWVSSDSGATWRHTVDAYSAISGEGRVVINLFAINPSNPLLLVGTGDYRTGTKDPGTFMSQDGGLTWAHAANPLVGTFGALRFGPDKSNAVYACSETGVARFDLKAQSWSSLNAGLGANTYCLAIAADQSVPGILFSSFLNGHVFKSVDDGATWNELNMPGTLAYTSLAINPKDSNQVYAGSLAGIAKSIDGGKNWIQTDGSGDIALDSSTPSTIYALSVFGLQVSYDSGLTWAAISNKPADFDTDMAVVPGTGSVYVSTIDASLLSFKPQ
jgi:photosystem II stability/assembly factor-like uncharacterized protein